MGSLLSVKRGYVNHPVVKLYAGAHLSCLVDYHGEAVTEMERRGWSGHKTPVSSELLEMSGLQITDETCEDWQDHVDKVVPLTGPYSLQTDMHDLIERWTNENKFLRSSLAAQFVSAHATQCDSACCVTYASSLVDEFTDRALKELRGPIKGHSSLRGEPFDRAMTITPLLA